jgi:hypothetical protein
MRMTTSVDGARKKIKLFQHVGVLFTIVGRVEFFFQLVQCGRKSQETDILFISGLFKTATCRGETYCTITVYCIANYGFSLHICVKTFL